MSEGWSPWNSRESETWVSPILDHHFPKHTSSVRSLVSWKLKLFSACGASVKNLNNSFVLHENCGCICIKCKMKDPVSWVSQFLSFSETEVTSDGIWKNCRRRKPGLYVCVFSLFFESLILNIFGLVSVINLITSNQNSLHWLNYSNRYLKYWSFFYIFYIKGSYLLIQFLKCKTNFIFFPNDLNRKS